MGFSIGEGEAPLDAARRRLGECGVPGEDASFIVEEMCRQLRVWPTAEIAFEAAVAWRVASLDPRMRH